MAVIGSTVISGAFQINNIQSISAFISGAVIAYVSGCTVFTYPSANGLQVYAGVTKIS